MIDALTSATANGTNAGDSIFLLTIHNSIFMPFCKSLYTRLIKSWHEIMLEILLFLNSRQRQFNRSDELQAKGEQ